MVLSMSDHRGTCWILVNSQNIFLWEKRTAGMWNQVTVRSKWGPIHWDFGGFGCSENDSLNVSQLGFTGQDSVLQRCIQVLKTENVNIPVGLFRSSHVWQGPRSGTEHPKPRKGSPHLSGLYPQTASWHWITECEGYILAQFPWRKVSYTIKYFLTRNL